jgi:tetratricopeptide (TPR) repeat protein
MGRYFGFKASSGPVPVILCACVLSTTGCALLRDYSKVEEAAAASAPETNWIARGDSAYEREEYAQAVVLYREAARRGQQEAVAWFNAANAMVRLDRNAEAAEAYRRALRVAPAFLKAQQNLAALRQLAGDLPEAARHYEAAARIDSGDAASRFRLGEMAQQSGDLPEAQRWFEDALRVDPLHEGAASGLAQALLAQRDTTAALLWMERYNARAEGKGRPAPWALMLQADLDLAAGRREEGFALYREAAASEPSDPRPWLRMARALRAAGRPLEAGVALRQGLEAAPARGELWAALGALRFEGGDPVGAREAFARAFRLGSAEGLQGLEMLAAWHDKRQDTAAAAAVRDTLGFKK